MIKAYYITEVGFILFEQTYKDWKITLEMFGFNFRKVQLLNGDYQWHLQLWESVMFEVLALVINFTLLKYYINQNDRKIRKEPYEYVHNSLYLCQYKKMQHFFFFCLVVNTFFCQTFIQLFVLGKSYLFEYWSDMNLLCRAHVPHHLPVGLGVDQVRVSHQRVHQDLQGPY